MQAGRSLARHLQRVCVANFNRLATQVWYLSEEEEYKKSFSVAKGSESNQKHYKMQDDSKTKFGQSL